MGQNLDQRKVEHKRVTMKKKIRCRNSYEKAMSKAMEKTSKPLYTWDNFIGIIKVSTLTEIGFSKKVQVSTTEKSKVKDKRKKEI